MTRKLTLLLLISFAVVSAQNNADPRELSSAQKLEIDNFIKGRMSAEQIPGVAVAVVKNGELAFAKGYGYANLEHQIPVKPETVFQSGSVGKTFTVMAVLMLAEEGKIDLEAPLKTYFPEIPDTWDKIKIRHMLEHTSGLAGYPKELNLQTDYSDQQLLDIYKKIPLEFEPGQSRKYSNVAFSMLGMLIGKVTGKFYGEYLKERIFAPLQMNSAQVISESDIVPNRASGYRLVDGIIKNQEWVAPTQNTDAAGSLYLSILDMAKWEAALNSGKLISAKMYEKMLSPIATADGVKQPWAMSWNLFERNGHHMIRHSGGWQGFTANFSRFPEKKLAVIVFTNRRGADPSSLCFGVEAILSPELTLAAAVPIKSKEPKIEKMIKEFSNGLVSNNVDTNLVTESVKDILAKHGEQASRELRSYGKLKSLDLIKSSKNTKEIREYQHRLNFEQKQLVLMTWVNNENKIFDIEMIRE